MIDLNYLDNFYVLICECSLTGGGGEVKGMLPRVTAHYWVGRELDRTVKLFERGASPTSPCTG